MFVPTGGDVLDEGAVERYDPCLANRGRSLAQAANQHSLSGLAKSRSSAAG